MPLPLTRRVVLFIVLDAFILLGVAGVFAAVHRSINTANPAEANAKLALTATPDSAVPQTAATHAVEEKTTPSPSKTVLTPSTIIPNKLSTAPSAELDAEPGQTVDLTRLRCKKIKVLTHQIEMKENYWQIAKNNNIDILTLIGANPGMPYKARVKQTLYLLPQRGVLYSVTKEDSIASISQAYGLTEKDLKDANDIHWWHGMKPGDLLFLPGARPLLMTKEWHDYFSRRGIFGDPLGRWGKINSTFGKRVDPLTGDVRHHNGVDLKAKYGDPVYAAASGKVTFTGISGGYGNLIVISHAGGLQTYYGHLSKIYVKMGQHVHRGVGMIGRVGATGRVTGPHLHFEVRKKGKAQDPLLYI